MGTTDGAVAVPPRVIGHGIRCAAADAGNVKGPIRDIGEIGPFLATLASGVGTVRLGKRHLMSAFLADVGVGRRPQTGRGFLVASLATDMYEPIPRTDLLWLQHRLGFRNGHRHRLRFRIGKGHGLRLILILGWQLRRILGQRFLCDPLHDLDVPAAATGTLEEAGGGITFQQAFSVPDDLAAAFGAGCVQLHEL